MTDSEGGAVRVCQRHSRVLQERGLHLVCPGPPRHVLLESHEWKVVLKRTGRALYGATLEKGATKVTNEKTTVEEAPVPKSQTLERAKFEDGAKLVLFIRLTKEPKRWGGDPFRIRWQQGPAGGKKGTLQGVAKTTPDEISGREAFKAAVKRAIAEGWKQVPIGLGRRTLELKPIPAPKKRAA